MSEHRKSRLRKLRWLVWLGLPLVLWWLARQLPAQDLDQAFRALSLTGLAALVVFNLFAMTFFSGRWWLILRALGYRLPYFALLRYRISAFSISYFTPGTQLGGEPVQVYALERQHALPRPAALASVALDKLFELLSNFTFLAVGLALILQQSMLKDAAPLLAAGWIAGLLLLPLAYLLALGIGRAPLSYLLARLPENLAQKARIVRLKALAQETESQITALMQGKPRAVLAVGLASLWIWALSLAEYWLAARVFGAPLSLGQAVIALTAARLAFLTPAPGGLGALEAGQALAFQALGYSPAVGLALSLWIRLRDIALGGLGFAWGALLAQSDPVFSLSSEIGD
jgi:hypothetical protein